MSTLDAPGGQPVPFVVVGEALMDILESPTHVEIPGGSPANVALGLGRLGVPVEFVTCLGDDPRGHRIINHLRASHVHLAADVFQANRTSTATVTLTDTGQPQYQFDITWNPPRRPLPPRRLHVGSIGAFLTPGADTVLDLVIRTHHAGGSVSIDPNIRPGLLSTPEKTRPVFEDLAKHADIVKLSDEDAEWLYPTTEPAEILDHLHSLGVTLAALTSGAHGSILSTASHTVHIPAPPTSVVDTVGAGDTYMATLLWTVDMNRLHDLTPDDLQQTGYTSGAAAAITVSRPGADLPWAAELHTALLSLGKAQLPSPVEGLAVAITTDASQPNAPRPAAS